VLIQEIVTLMTTEDRSMRPIVTGMHIHLALSEVVKRALIRKPVSVLADPGYWFLDPGFWILWMS
jgi:dihydrolipoamide dehydrogenase